MTGVVACACPRALGTAKAVAAFRTAVAPAPLIAGGEACAAAGTKAIAAAAKKRGLDGIVLAGCPLVFRDDVAPGLAAAAGLPAARILPVLADARQAARALAALDAVPAVATSRRKLGQEVLVVGAGSAGRETARLLASLGHPVTIVDLCEIADTAALAGAGTEAIGCASIASFQGAPGAFTARIAGPDGPVERAFGAAVIATGVEVPDDRTAPFAAGRVIPLPSLLDHLGAMRRRDLPRSVAIALDWRLEEGRASSTAAFRACRALASRYPGIAATLVLRDAKVSSLELEAAYDEVREGGTAVLKHDGRPTLRVDPAGPGAVLAFRDDVAGAPVALAFDLVAISPWGLRTPADARLASILGLDADAEGRYQPDNIHLLPCRTNRDGVFAVGACRGETWEPSVLRDAADAALAVHALLAPKRAIVEAANAVVDADKCALCLTCIRTCPFRAMRVHAADRRAESIAESCRRCGTCVGECPNRAITLPAWSEDVVLMLAGARAAKTGAARAASARGASRAGAAKARGASA